jgi:hypothetical protein
MTPGMIGIVMPIISIHASLAKSELTSSPTLLDPLFESVHIVKQLRDHKVRSSITLDFQPPHFAIWCFRVGVRCRIPSYSNTESILVFLANVFDQIVCVLEVIRLNVDCESIFIRSRWITT